MFGTGVVIMMMWTAEAEEGWYDNNKAYRRTGKGLTEVPTSDIPAQAVEVYLGHNKITVIAENVFKHLNVCVDLYLHYNNMKTIESGAFNGLVNLKNLYLSGNEIKEIRQDTFFGLTQCATLDLNNNKIHEIHSHALEGMKSLSELELQRNSLSSVPWTIFGKEHPKELELRLDENPLICDSMTLCWLKQGENDGWIVWHIGRITGSQSRKVYTPECQNTTTEWSNISIDCSHIGMRKYNIYI